MNKYLEKIAGMSRDTKHDLATTAKVMGAGTIAGGIGMGINHAIDNAGETIVKSTSPLGQRVLSATKTAMKPHNLRSMAVLGAVGGIGDYLAIKHSAGKTS
jgi:hypothetical protein